MTQLTVTVLPVLSDNYAYLLTDPAGAMTAVVDPGEAAPVESALAKAGRRLTHILVTHRHGDHVGGVERLKAAHGATVIGPAAEAAQIPGIDRQVAEGDAFDLGGTPVHVFDTPGHTAGHISFHIPDIGALFPGDTLFVLGCGRLFEGSARQMWDSLVKLRALPAETAVYCGHEYTLTNARFAVSVDPDNEALARRKSEIERQREAGRPTIPSTLAEECRTNPFLRADDAALARHLGRDGAPPAEVFAEIRRRKDSF